MVHLKVLNWVDELDHQSADYLAELLELQRVAQTGIEMASSKAAVMDTDLGWRWVA